MHKKTNPIIFREGKTQTLELNSWCTTNKKHYVQYLNLSVQIRSVIEKFFNGKKLIPHRIFIDIFSIKKCQVFIFTSSLYKFIGNKGSMVNELTQLIKNIIPRCIIKIIKSDILTASFVAKNLSLAIEKREPTNKLVKGWVFRMLKDSNILGYQIILSGRLNGSEKTKLFKHQNGTLPLHTLNKLIDYDCSIAKTANAGTIGCKVILHVKKHLLKDYNSSLSYNLNNHKEQTQI